MKSAIELFSAFWTGGCPAGWLDAWIKSVLVLFLALSLRLGRRRTSAATRHGLCLTAFISLPFLPLIAGFPSTGLPPLWVVSSQSRPGNEISLCFALAPSYSASHSEIQPQSESEATADLAESSVAGRWSTRLGDDFVTAFFVFWAVGAAVLLLRLGLGQIRLRRLEREAIPLDDRLWTALLAECQGSLAMERKVKLCRSSGEAMPMTWGVVRSVVLLPFSAVEWPQARRRVVLWHELAHVKRRDCLAQLLVQFISALFWMNPLVWLARQLMSLDRERACDDLVLNGGFRASEYAGHLVEIARSFRPLPQGAGITMAQRTGLQQRVGAILDIRQNRSRIGKLAMGASVLLILGVALLGAGYAAESSPGGWSLDRSAAAGQLKRFVAEKKAQAEAGCRSEGKEFLPDYAKLFAAAGKGDWLTISNVFEDLRMRAPQYEHKTAARDDDRLHGIAWETIKEVWGGFSSFNSCGDKYCLAWSDGIIGSIPPGSIYFGGTDPGRFLITAMTKSQVHGDPFYVLTQNALADRTYLDYARSMYEGRVYIPTTNDQAKCFQDYIADASERLTHDEAFPSEPKQVKPGENLKTGPDGRVQVSGQVAVMSINGLLARMIFDHTTNREFFVEESFPLEWMYPHLEPHGLVMKLNRRPLPELPPEVVRADHEYWTTFVKPMIGGWLTENTSVQQIADFVDRVYVRHDFHGFEGDREFALNKDPQRMFSKLRSSLAGVYAWRVENDRGTAEKKRMIREADFAYRQAWALCPDSPEAVFRYVQFLMGQKRVGDALRVAETAFALDEHNTQIETLVTQLKKLQSGQ